MPPGHPRVEGRQQLVEFIQENFGKVRTIALSNWNVDGRADLAVVTTNVRWYNDSPDGEEPAGTAKQMIFLCKDSGRRWLVRTVIYNSDSLT